MKTTASRHSHALRRVAVALAFSLFACGASRGALAQSPNATADPVAEFYRGKTVNVVIGYTVGGGFDLYARVLARDLGRFIPGNPSVVPQNMPGAASLKAVEYLFAVAPRDGTVIGTFSHTIPIAPLLGTAKFDPRELRWVGSMASETSLCVASANSPVKSWADLKRLPFTAGGTGRGSDPDMLANLLKSLFGVPIKLVSGYPGTAEIVLATERGEVDGFCGLSLSTLTSRYKDWKDSGKVNILLQAGLQKAPELPEVPMVLDLASTERERQILTLLIAPQKMARPYAMPPGTPPARADAVRKAFAATLADPEFLADAQKSRIDISPVFATEIETLLARLYATPADVVQQAVTAIGN